MKIKNFLILLTLFLFSCEDVIDIETDSEAPKLVIEASINWFKNTTGNEQSIKLTLSAPYFENTIQPATGAQVFITDTNNNTFTFTEDANTGIYKTTSFIPEIEGVYNLTINYNNETYTATETLKSVVEIDYIEQNNEGGFSNDEIEIKAFYTDPADAENYYFFEFLCDIPKIPRLEVYKDEFINGNQIFAIYREEDLESGDVVTIKNYGVSRQFYNFMFLLLQQNNQSNGGPFDTQPATILGNCVNQTNPDNFPLGYFRLSEATEFLYTVE